MVQDGKNRQRFFFDDAAKTYFESGGTGATSLDGFTCKNGTGTDIVTIDGIGNYHVGGAITSNSTIDSIVAMSSLGITLSI